MPCITFRDENGQNREVPLTTAEVIIGRQDDCAVVIRKMAVSRRHARIWNEDGRWWVEDLGSAYGTFVNDERLEDAHALEAGDRVTVSSEVVTFQEKSGIPAAASSPMRSLPAPSSRDATDVMMQLPEGEAILKSMSIDSSELLRAIQQVRDVDVRNLSKAKVDTTSAGHLVQLVKISDELRRCHGVEAVCQTAARMAVDATGAGRGVLALREKDDKGNASFVTKVQIHTNGDGGDVIVSKTFVDRMVRERVSLLAADAGQDVEFSAAKSIVAAKLRSLLGAPLWDGDEILGYLYIDTEEAGRRFSEDDMNLCTAIGHQAAAEIVRLRITESRRNLSRFVSADVIKHIEERSAKGELDPSMDAREQDVTIMFADIRGFTSMSEVMKPKDVKLLLDDYFDRMMEIIVDQYGGTLDKYIGDAIMALFGAPFSQGLKVDAARAVGAAVAMRDAVAQLRAKRMTYKNFHVRIGLNTGSVVAGMIGSPRRLEYSVLGDAVNVASRLESNGEADKILIGGSTYEAVRDRFTCEFAGDRKVKNREKPIPSWWVIEKIVGDDDVVGDSEAE